MSVDSITVAPERVFLEWIPSFEVAGRLGNVGNIAERPLTRQSKICKIGDHNKEQGGTKGILQTMEWTSQNQVTAVLQYNISL